MQKYTIYIFGIELYIGTYYEFMNIKQMFDQLDFE